MQSQLEPKRGYVTCKSVDAIYNVFALINALILIIPFILLIAGGPPQWDSLKVNISNCTYWPDSSSLSTLTPGFVASTYYENYYWTTSTAILLCIYCPLFCLIQTIWYFLTRPEENLLSQQHEHLVPAITAEAIKNKNFRAWWQRGRFSFMIMFVISGVGMCALLYLADMYFVLWFSASSDWCAKAVTRYRQHTAAFVAFVLTVLASLYMTF